METFVKDPDGVIDYQVDWAKWLSGDVINASCFIITSNSSPDTSPLELTSSVSASTNDDTTATIWLQLGTVGNKYTITNRITTTGGRTQDQSFLIFVREK